MLLFKSHEDSPHNALTAVKYVRVHTQEDEKALFRGYYESIGIVIAGSIIASQIIPSDDATQAARAGLSAGLTCASLYLTQFISETRKRLDQLQEKFKNVAGFINDKEHLRIAPMTRALFKKRENFNDAVSLRKHPIRNGLAAIFAISGISFGEPGLAGLGLSAALFTYVLDIFHDEEHANKGLHKASTQAKIDLLDPAKDVLEDIRDELSSRGIDP